MTITCSNPLGERSVFPSNLDNHIKKQLKFEHFLFLVFLNMATGDLHAIPAVLVLQPKCLSKVRRREISHTPSSCFWDVPWGEVKDGQLPLHPLLMHQQSERCLRGSRSHRNHRHDHLKHSHLLPLISYPAKWAPTWPISWVASDPVKSGVDHCS
jgi:hypothetical protein